MGNSSSSKSSANNDPSAPNEDSKGCTGPVREPDLFKGPTGPTGLKEGEDKSPKGCTGSVGYGYEEYLDEDKFPNGCTGPVG